MTHLLRMDLSNTKSTCARAPVFVPVYVHVHTLTVRPALHALRCDSSNRQTSEARLITWATEMLASVTCANCQWRLMRIRVAWIDGAPILEGTVFPRSCHWYREPQNDFVIWNYDRFTSNQLNGLSRALAFKTSMLEKSLFELLVFTTLRFSYLAYGYNF